MVSLGEELHEHATAAGIDFVGVTSVAPFHLEIEGRHVDPLAIMPQARALVVTGLRTFIGETQRPSEPGAPRGCFGPWTRLERPASEYQHRVVTGFLRTRGWQVRHAGDIPVKAAAVRAGWAQYGKNCIVHAQGAGSYLEIDAFLTDANLEPADRPIRTSDCGDCRACLDACPTGALSAPYHLDREHCVCAWLWGMPIPIQMRPAVGNHVHQCSYCQDVCPLNEGLAPRGIVPFELDGPTASPELIPLVEADDRAMEAMLPAFVLSAGAETLRRNAAVALGNNGDPAAVPSLSRLLREGAEEVRGYAAWALGRIGGGQAKTALHSALATETLPEVRLEIVAALEDEGSDG